MVTPTFVNVDSTKPIALKDLQLKSNNTKTFEAGNNLLEIFGTGGNPQTIAADDQLYTDFPEAYAKFSVNPKAELIFTYNGTHWYLVADTTNEHIMDAYVIQEGQGIYLNCGKTLAKGFKMTSSGAVVDHALPIAVKSGKFAMAGNSTPVDRALSEFVMTSGNTKPFEAGNNLLEIFGTGGNPQTIAADDQLYTDFPEAYAKFSVNPKAELIFTFDGTHWYLNADTGCEFIMDSYVIKAGQGVYLNSAKTLAKGYTFEIPKPIDTPAAK